MEFDQSIDASLTLIRSLDFATYVSLVDFAIDFRVKFECSQTINLLNKWRSQRFDH